jgi:hypothetical protein
MTGIVSSGLCRFYEEDEMKLNVKSVSLYTDEGLKIIDTDGKEHLIPHGKQITVTMLDRQDKREETTMLAYELGPYLAKGYLIEMIEFEA